MKHAVRLFVTIALLTFATACATTGTLLGPSPEAQIKTVSNSVTVVATLATTLLKIDKITVTQAKSYSAVLHAASNHLNDANKTLVACRTKTNSKAGMNPDPCAATVASDIDLAGKVIGDVQAVLDAKK